MTSCGERVCVWAATLLLFMGAASALFYPTPPTFSVLNNDTLNAAVSNGHKHRIIFRDAAQPNFALEFLDIAGPSSSFAPGAKFTLSIVVRPNDAGYRWIPVWSANRNRPVGQNAKLAVEGQGNLVLRDADGTLVWCTATSFADPSKIGVDMTSTGNMLLLDEANGQSEWESFASPADTLLPGQLLNTGSVLTASKSSSDTSSGAFRFSAEPNGVALFNQQAAYWWQSKTPSNQTLYATQHTCEHFHNVLFTVENGLEIAEGGLATYGGDESICAQPELEGNAVVIAPTVAPASPPFVGVEPVTTFQFARVDADGVVRLYSYSAMNNAWAPVAGRRVPLI